MAISVSTKSTGMNPYNTYMDLSQAANQIDTDIDRITIRYSSARTNGRINDSFYN